MGDLPDRKDLYELVDPKNPEQLQAMGGVQGLAQKLGCDLDSGLSSDQTIHRNRETYGENRLPPAQFKSFLDLVWETLHDRTLIMLIIAACISLVVGMAFEDVSTGWIDGTAVFIAVSVVVIMTSFNDYQKELQFRKLNDKKSERDVSVRRNGVKQRLLIFDLVVGDILILETGDIIPADGVLIKGEALECDESASTGESNTIRKGADKDQFFLSGTQLVAGTGEMLVIAVGEYSYNGRILLALRAPAEDTPLQIKLSKLADIIGNFGIIAATVIFMAQLIKYFAINGSDLDGGDTASELVHFLVIAITIVVVAVPEGLPLAVTIALAYSMKAMMKDNNLVRRLDACETMGGATTICSDKTGTLTQNKMTVVEGLMCNKQFDSSHLPTQLDIPEDKVNMLMEGISINSNAYESKKEDGSTEFIGSKTECALLQFAQKFGTDYEAVRKAKPVVTGFPFSSDRKRMCAIVPRDNTDGEGSFTFHCKGASEVVLRLCSSYVQPDGHVVPIDETIRKRFEEQIQVMATDALRTICLAYRPTEDKDKDWTEETGTEAGLVVLAIVGIRDPLREEVPDAVKRCQDAGVVVRMVTGDNAITAKNIAKSCGIYKEELGHIVIEGPVFRKLSEAEMDKVTPMLRVMARSAPTDKLLLVASLQRAGEVVAVTGDGVNDGPALKKSNVGFSMGITGTEVAKEASAIVLLDDNFASIVNAIKWGRSVFDNIRKFLQFQLTVNFTAIAVVLIGILADPEGRSESAPLKPVQLLWINLIMDTFAALALATEPPNPDVLKYKPYGHKEPLMTPYMKHRMIIQIVLQTATMLTVLYGTETLFATEKDPLDDPDDNLGQFSIKHYTVVFTVFVLSQLFNQFNSRKLRPTRNVFSGLTHHPLFCGIWLFAFGVQILMVTFGGDFVEVRALNIKQWLGCIAFALLPLLWTFLFNLLPRKFITRKWYFPWEKLKKRKRKNESNTATSNLEWDDSLTATSIHDAEAGVAPHSSVHSLAAPEVGGIDEAEDDEDVVAVVSPVDRWTDAFAKVSTQLHVVGLFRRDHR